MQNSGKVVCPRCGKEWNWVIIRREKTSSGSISEVFDVLEENTLYLSGTRAACQECGTELNIK